MLDFRLPGDDQALAHSLAQETPIVLMGRGHSGTRVLQRICTHLGVELGPGDVRTGDVADRRFQKIIKRIALQSLGTTSLDQVRPDLLRAFRRAAFRYRSSLDARDGLWGWKFPETYLIGPYVAAAFPRARYLHLVRDGRDVAFKDHLTDRQSNALGRAILDARGVLDRPHHIQAAASWAYQVDLFDEFRTELAPDRVLDIRFVDLATRPRKAAGAICAFLDLPLTESCRRYLDEEIDADKVNEHRHQSTAQVREVEAHVGATLRRYAFL